MLLTRSTSQEQPHAAIEHAEGTQALIESEQPEEATTYEQHSEGNILLASI